MAGREGWTNCVGGNTTISHFFGGRNLCAACGAMFAAIPDGYVPTHDAPSAGAVIAAIDEIEAQAE